MTADDETDPAIHPDVDPESADIIATGLYFVFGAAIFFAVGYAIFRAGFAFGGW